MILTFALLRKQLLVVALLALGFLLTFGGINRAQAATESQTYEFSSVKKRAVVRSGLLDDFGLATTPVVSKLQRQGYSVSRVPWWWPVSGKVDLMVGHSMGGSMALLCPKSQCKRVVTIDPPRMNAGCRKGGGCTNYYNRYNFPGGGYVRGAANKSIGWGHLSAPWKVAPVLR